MAGALTALMRGLCLGARFPSIGIAPAVAAIHTPLYPMNNQILLKQVRTKTMKASRRIRGYPRPLVKGIVRPEPNKYGYRLIKPQEYTTEPVRLKKLGGRDPETGRVVVRTIGGGYQRFAHWVDFMRDGPTEGFLEEKVYEIKNDDLQTAKLALVAHGEKKRWIIATEGIQVGQILRTTRELPRMPVRARIGDAHPLGALPVGTQVHCIEYFPGTGAHICRAAGASGRIQRKVSGRVVVELPSSRTMALSEHCLAVVGQVSNADRMATFYPIGSPNRLRRLGHRPRSGFWHRKDGYCGRKIKRHPPVKIMPIRRPTITSQYVIQS
ncbi:39S ribosomal protein L2, mitochondrial-like [Varroa jacobsoni]|uniref:Ribosomal protein L2 n=1 Tax=Varroa destructor TaxID=109461 RepID=A0A7M7KEN2_VARDE|nr:39S ribosomal protein L2, mitochondrial-like [Varroa destructor]XP_022701209.1 39S ribosomal protein L2, mitochondrial-like [Varroa jacobsoni]